MSTTMTSAATGAVSALRALGDGPLGAAMAGRPADAALLLRSCAGAGAAWGALGRGSAPAGPGMAAPEERVARLLSAVASGAWDGAPAPEVLRRLERECASLPGWGERRPPRPPRAGRAREVPF